MIAVCVCPSAVFDHGPGFRPDTYNHAPGRVRRFFAGLEVVPRGWSRRRLARRLARRAHGGARAGVRAGRRRAQAVGSAPNTQRSRVRVRLAAIVHRRLPCRVSCNGRARPVVPRGKEAMGYQPPPDYEADTAARNPPGWYLDPIGLQSLRWWDGARWARNTQPLLGPIWERPPPYPDATVSASGGDGAFRQPGARRHRQQDGPQGGMGDAPGPASASFPPAGMQAQPVPGQSQDPQGSPDRQSRVPGPPSPAHHASRRRRNRKARGALTGLGALIGSSSPSARLTRTARHRQES